MAKLAAIIMYESIEKLKLWDHIKIVNMVHDELIFEVSDSHLEIAEELIKDATYRAAKTFCKKVDVPCSFTISKH